MNRASCLKAGDLVVHINGEWGHMPRLVIKVHETAKSLIGLLADGEVRYTHYKFLKVVSSEGVK